MPRLTPTTALPLALSAIGAVSLAIEVEGTTVTCWLSQQDRAEGRTPCAWITYEWTGSGWSVTDMVAA